MESFKSCREPIHGDLPFHTCKVMPRAMFNRVFAVIYTCGILALFYHHTQTLLRSKTFISFSITSLLFLSDLILAFMWVITQSCHMRPVKRKEFPENLKRVVKTCDLPGLDVFICTCDPYKENPITVVNTALSVMGYDYPADKISVYVSDDGGSELTLFALMEAANFAGHWLPFCRDNNLVDRNPEVYFASNGSSSSESEVIKVMYEKIKMKIEHVMERGKVGEDYINEIENQHREAFNYWTNDFTRLDHPTVIQILLGSKKDTSGYVMPNLVYISREKNINSHHNFKAGALNTLLRISATMTNAPIILTQDCDMYSNDPQTIYRALCYFLDPPIKSRLSYVQFPQRFSGLNKHDIYACEFKSLFFTNAFGMDGFCGYNYVGTNCFFNRRAFFGDPSNMISPEISKLDPTHVVDKSTKTQQVLVMAHKVASCNYEKGTNWGSKIGFKYGSVVEDYFTGYRLQCEGWRSVFCNPDKAAFYGNAPINLLDVLTQTKRWCIGLLQVGFSKFCPMIFGVKNRGFFVGLAYSHFAFWAIWAFPLTIYAFLPQLAILNGLSIFPKVSESWFFLYLFLFIGAYVKDSLNFLLEGDSIQKWWNDQRMWMIRGITSYQFGLTEFTLKSLGINPAHGFEVTNKVIDHEQHKRYEQELFEFGVASPLFVPLSMVAIINLFSFLRGLVMIFNDNNDVMRGEGTLVLQFLLACFISFNCLPIYESMSLRGDNGKMPARITITATFIVLALYVATNLSCN